MENEARADKASPDKKPNFPLFYSLNPAVAVADKSNGAVRQSGLVLPFILIHFMLSLSLEPYCIIPANCIQILTCK
ncbi:MAG: hypothetical protein A2X11_06870 [Bacteroidetes bacterium GWE2_42_24]|nr:MAG: hypothetical protein A2X11_06870 [Bacteroidetes bacterium GWE2_42_24]OFY25974.1 MAG: hypothetical protein A2X09_04725 [Bacteroidetes bacterium GWF2_43_11]